MLEGAFPHVGIIGNMVFGKGARQRHGVGGQVRQKQRHFAVAHPARRLGTDGGGDKAHFVLFVGGGKQPHAVCGQRLRVDGIEQAAAQRLRLGDEPRGQGDDLHRVPRPAAAARKVGGGFACVQCLFSADEKGGNAARRRDGGADAFRRLAGEGRKADEPHLRARELRRAHGIRQQREDAAFVYIPFRQKIEIGAVDEGDIGELFAQKGIRLLLRRLEHFGRDQRRAQLGDGLVQRRRAGKGAEVAQLTRKAG